MRHLDHAKDAPCVLCEDEARKALAEKLATNPAWKAVERKLQEQARRLREPDEEVWL